MLEEEFIKRIELAWDVENGYFYELRSRNFNLTLGEELLHDLENFVLSDSLFISKHLVKLLWYIPIYLEYQKENLKPVLTDIEYNKYVVISNKMQGEIERILGYP